MEIYKLGDEVPVGQCKAEGVLNLQITDLKQGVKNPNRVNVYVNGKYELSLDVAQVVDYGLKIGRVLNLEELAELKKASEFGKLYQRTLEWVLVRPRSVREVRDYLWRKLHKVSLESSERVREEHAEFLRLIIERLVEKGYVDDYKFAEWYVENRFVKKGVSQRRLRMELTKKGVAKGIIDEALSGRDDVEEINKMIAKKRGKYDNEKLIQYLCRQGFSYELVRDAVNNWDD